MNSIKILPYEIKRLVFSKIYALLLLVIIFDTYNILSSKIILGVAYTAPFSKWSYSSFLCEINPFLLITTIYFCTFIFSRKELSVRTITLATKLSAPRYFLLKSTAVFIAYIITALVVILESFIFYAIALRFYNFTDFIFPILLYLIPSFSFIFGLSMLIGSIKGMLLYVLIPVTFIMGSISFGNIIIDPFGKGIANSYPFSLNTDVSGDVPFILPSGMEASRFIYFMLGVSMIILVSVMSAKSLKKQKK